LYRKKIEAESNHFVDISAYGQTEAANKISNDKIDILVDLKGHTEDTRLEILALKPSPIQISWLGYPGTTGADFIDYITNVRKDNFDKIENSMIGVYSFFFRTEEKYKAIYQSLSNKEQLNIRYFYEYYCYEGTIDKEININSYFQLEGLLKIIIARILKNRFIIVILIPPRNAFCFFFQQ